MDVEYYTASSTYLCIWENIVIVTFGEEVGSALNTLQLYTLHLKTDTHTHTPREFRISRMNSSARNFLWISTFSHSRMDGIEYGKINCYFLYFIYMVYMCCMSCLMQTEYNEWTHRTKVVFDELNAFVSSSRSFSISNGMRKCSMCVCVCVRQRSERDYVHTINFEAKHRKFVRLFARRKFIWFASVQ